MNSSRFPQHAGDPEILLFLTVDEVIPAGLIIGVGAAIHYLILSVFIAGVVVRLYKKFVESKPRGYLMHRFYLTGLVPKDTRTFINPFVKRIIT